MQDLESKLGLHLRSELTKIRSKDKQIAKFVLRHASPGAKGNDVESWDHDERLELDQIEMLAAEISGRAQTDADGLGSGVHRYTLQTVLNKGVNGNRFVFRVRANETGDDEVAGEDSPTQKGLLGQLMRHNEANNRTLHTALGGIVSMMSRQMVSMGERMQSLEAERATTFLALEAAKTEAHDRDMDAMKTLEDEKRKGQAFDKLMQLGPVVVNRIVGKDIMPTGGVDPLAMILNNLGESLTQDQVRTIAATLRPEQQLQFMEVMETAKRKNTASGVNGTNGEKKEN